MDSESINTVAKAALDHCSTQQTEYPPAEFLTTPIDDLNQIGNVYVGPGGHNYDFSTQKILPKQQDAINKARKYAMEQSIEMVRRRQNFVHQQQKNMYVVRQQALTLMCRIYVGSIHFEVTEDTIRQTFSSFGPIKSINMTVDQLTQKHKGFAFVEYEFPEAAELAYEQMNGAVLGGRSIKVVKRPTNMPQAQTAVEEIAEESKHFNRIYVASIHQDISEDEIKSVFEAFGPITYCKLAQLHSSGRHKGCGFIEFQSLQSALDAVSSMNLFDLGGQLLRVGRAVTPPNPVGGLPRTTVAMPTATAVAAATATAKIQAMDAVASNAAAMGLTSLPGISKANSVTSAALPPPGFVIPQALTGPSAVIAPPTVVTSISISTPLVSNSLEMRDTEALRKAQEKAQLKQQEELQKKILDETVPETLQQQEDMVIKGKGARHLIMQKLMRKVESRVVILKNMVSAEDVDDILQEEIQDECSKFGAVNKVVIYKEKQSDENDDRDTIVKIFVEFSNHDEAEEARNSLDGRYFGGRIVKGELYDQTSYDHHDYSG